MTRWFAGIAAVLLIVAGGVLALQGRAEEPSLPAAPQPRLAAAVPLSPIPNAPEADSKGKEEKRFARADKDEDGRITLAELVEPRRKAFAKLDVNSDGLLSFEEWAVKTIDKFEGADADDNEALNPAEYASTAPKRKPKPACACS
ncbi:MAG: EF-hand domain-containing protein [Pseudomonadota bacterium]|nr:EF-hand domain-containing protein [Pseudomonadota bacterium]